MSTNVYLNRQSLLDYVEHFKGFDEVEFPELEGKFGCEKGEIPILKIKAASLDDQIRANGIHEKAMIGALKLIQRLGNNDMKALGFEGMKRELDKELSDKTHLEIALFHKCCVQPAFSLLEAVKISEKLPEVVNRVARIALQLSSMENVNGDYQRS